MLQVHPRHQERWRCGQNCGQPELDIKISLVLPGILGEWVAHTGFEPVISALKERRPRPLDECASEIHTNAVYTLRGSDVKGKTMPTAGC